MRFLAIDFGLARTGIAVTDADGLMAFPRCTLVRTTRDAFFTDVCACIEAEAPDALVVGLPLTQKDEDSETTRQVRNFVKSLKRRCPLPVYYMPEMFSTCQAHADLDELDSLHELESGKRRPRRDFRTVRAMIDQQAAVRILESFLNLPASQRQLA